MIDDEGEPAREERDVAVLPAITMQARATVRAYFSLQALLAATRSATKGEELEEEHPGDWADPHVGEHLQAVTSAVIYSAIFLEALVSEWFTDAAEQEPGPGTASLEGIDARTKKLMKGWWDATEGRGSSPLERHQMALLFADQPQLPAGESPYQPAKALLTLPLGVRRRCVGRRLQLRSRRRTRDPVSPDRSVAGPGW
ncbi:MAG TPA: hypothetical protein VFK41_00305 [Nocardioidaceae bacterium]|nr:hypothetical protein [Nocardioidaceae bacterium]